MKLPLNSKENIYYRELPTQLCTGLCDGAERSWREYVPSSCDSSEEVPLVVVLHGGASGGKIVLHTAEKQAAWTHVAEEYGFIAVFPHSLTDKISWNVWEIYSGGSGTEYRDDVVFLDWLIDLLCEKYPVNRKRIYLYGHSFGAVMAAEYALKRAGRLAAACLCSGPENASGYTRPDGNFFFGKDSALPMLIYHGSEDLSAPSGKWPHVSEGKLVACNPVKDLIERTGAVNDEARKLKMELALLPNLLLWRSVNGSDGSVRFFVKNDLNIVEYMGEQPVCYVVLENGGHFPPVYAAEYIWKYYFSTYINCGGKRMRFPAWERLGSDSDALFFADGSDGFVMDGQPEKAYHPVAEKSGKTYISLRDASMYFPAAHGILKTNGNTEIINDIEYVSLELCAKVSGLKYTKSRGISYIADREGCLSYDMAYLIKVTLGLEKALTPKDCYELEKRELEKLGHPIPEYDR